MPSGHCPRPCKFVLLAGKDLVTAACQWPNAYYSTSSSYLRRLSISQMAGSVGSPVLLPSPLVCGVMAALVVVSYQCPSICGLINSRCDDQSTRIHPIQVQHNGKTSQSACGILVSRAMMSQPSFDAPAQWLLRLRGALSRPLSRAAQEIR